MQGNSNTTTIIYKDTGCVVICSLKLTQRTGNDPSIVVVSPENVVRSSLFKIDTQTTKHHIMVHSVSGGSFVNYVNSIAMCLLKAGIPCDVPVGVIDRERILIYSPQNDKIIYFIGDRESPFDELKNRCLEKYNAIVSSLN